MFVAPSLYFLSLLFCLLAYWSFSRDRYEWRATLLTTYSVVIITLLLPVLGVFLLVSSFIAYLYKFAFRINPSIKVSVLFVVSQVFLMILPDLTDLSFTKQSIALVGMSYFTLRNIGFIIDVYKKKTDAGFSDLLFLNSFFPTYSAGPVENIKTFNTKVCDTGFSLDEFLMGIVRISVGVLKFYLFSGVFLSKLLSDYPGGQELLEADIPTFIFVIVASWFSLYIAFSGYADIAIGSAKLFNIRVRENFNFPFLATNIQKFWQRWNISLMNFVSEYIYMNFVRVTGWKIRGIFMAFIGIGIWHHLTPNYIFWGVAHGSAMASIMYLRRSRHYHSFEDIMAKNILVRYVYSATSWGATILFVSFVSYVANLGY